MAFSDIEIIGMCNDYTDETVLGGGAIKGKNCKIQSVTPIYGGQRITYKWVLDDGTEQTTTMDVPDGKDLSFEDFSVYDDAVNVMDCGATGDGETDDSDAFIAAIESGHSVILIPRGSYNLDHKLIELTSMITFVGESNKVTKLLAGNIEAPYGIIAKSITFDGGTQRVIYDTGFPSTMQSKDVTIFVTPRHEDASVIYENCIFRNTGIASLAFYGKDSSTGTLDANAKPLTVSNVTGCTFEDITYCGIWHSVAIESSKCVGNTFKNIGDGGIVAGKVWSFALGDISNNTAQEVTDATITDNVFDTLITDIDLVTDRDDPNYHDINVNHIALMCDKALVENNMIKDIVGYGHDHEAVYIKGNDVDISHNTMINGCPGGEGFICCKHKPFNESAKRLIKIHDNNIVGESGAGIQCYGSGDIRDNYICISRVERAIRGLVSHPLYGESLIIEGNNISCGVGPLTVGETEITGYGPENIISAGSEYANGVHINDNTIAITNDDYPAVFAPVLIKVQNIISDIEIKGNIASKSASGTALLMSDSKTTSLIADKNITIDVEGNVFDTQQEGGLYLAVKENTHLKKTFIVKGNSVKSIVLSGAYGIKVESYTGNTDVLEFETNQPKNAFPSNRPVLSTVKEIYSSLASNFFQIDASKTKVYSAALKNYLITSTIKDVVAASSDFADFQSRMAAL